ncbi:hypothetical protein [Pseudomonas sp. W03]|uniref:hypothetical protein n=1 Tax=Pseudomonas sp. W03 TaxID=3090666 RepID=UPI003A4D5737
MLTLETSSRWQPARRWLDGRRAAAWRLTTDCEQEVSGLWGAGEAVDPATRVGWETVPQVDLQPASAWSEGAAQDAGAGSAWSLVSEKDGTLRLAWDRSIRQQDVRLRLIYNPLPPRVDLGNGQGWYRCDELGPRLDVEAERLASLYIPPAGIVSFNFAGRYVPPGAGVFFNFRYVPPSRAIQPVDSGAAVRFTPARILEQMRTMPWGWGTPADPTPTGIVYPDYPGPVVVIDPPDEPDILETYMIANTVTLVVLPSGVPVDATNIRVGLDIDSFAWTFSAELFGRTSLNQVVPDASGPKTVELTINGWTWRFLVERWSGSGKHPAETFSISGASRTQLLAAPYAPKRSAVNSVSINARQVVDDLLQSTGFTASWDIVGLGPPDWTLPTGSMSYQDQTPMEVIHRLAEVVGGVVRPDAAGDGLTVLPRYREAVWNWGAAVPDRIIAGEVVAEWGSEWSPQPNWNFVYVSGTNHGVGVQVRRAGTAGDEPAADVLDDWMTSPDAARARGICELSKGGGQSIETRRIPLFHVGDSAPGLVLPAMLAEVRDEATPWRGLVLGVEIAASGVGASTVWQTLKIERHYGSS